MENEIEKEENKEEARKYHYIYFNEIHDKVKEVKIEISKDYEGFNTLESYEGKNPFQSAFYTLPILNIYRFKLYPDIFEQKNKDRNIAINFEQQDKKDQFKFNLENIDIHKDYYEYDLNKKGFQIDLFKTNTEQQIEIYDNFIQNILNKKPDSKEYEEFILSTQRLI